MSQENVEAFKRALEAYNRRDIDSLIQVLDPEVEWHPGVLISLEGNWPIFGFLEGDGEKNWLLVSNIILVANLALVAAVYVPRGKVFEQKLKDAVASGASASAVRAELDDSLVRVGHYFEYASILVILYLMSFKPF